MIKRIIFDLDETLVVSDYTKVGKYLKSLDNNIDISFIMKLDDYFDEYELKYDKYNLNDLYEFMVSKTNYPIKFDDFKKTIDYTADILVGDNSVSRNVLEKLSKKYDIYILTNWFYDIQMKKIKEAGLDKYITKVISGETSLKPNKASYYSCLDGLSPSECLVIGDNYNNDVLSPKKLGFNVLWYNYKNKTNFDNVLEVNKLEDIPSVIERI